MYMHTYIHTYVCTNIHICVYCNKSKFMFIGYFRFLCNVIKNYAYGFSRQEYWSGLPFPSPGDLPNPGIKPTSPALASGFFTIELPGNNGYWGTISCICDSEQPEIEKGRTNTPKERKSFVRSHHHRWALRFVLPRFPDGAWEWGWGCKRDFSRYFDHAQILRDRSGLWLD